MEEDESTGTGERAEEGTDVGEEDIEAEYVFEPSGKEIIFTINDATAIFDEEGYTAGIGSFFEGDIIDVFVGNDGYAVTMQKF